MKIIVDAMGGDNAPGEIVKGAVQAAAELGVEICLVGKGEEILKALKEQGCAELPPRVEISHASQTVEMCDPPATMLRDKPDSSMAVGLKLLTAGGGDAFVSAGSTGALLAGSIFTVKRIRGIKRAALAPIVPTKSGGALLIDCGANLDCKPEYLLQFAFMGGFFMSSQKGIASPRVGLLNIGAEETKGTDLQKQTYALLTDAHRQGRLNFAGNVEARDVAFGVVDVVVADGYSGNIFLKTMEGVGLFFSDMLKDMFMKSAKTKLGALLVKDGLRSFKKTLDYAEVGGSPLLGLARPVIKAHGSSNAKALFNAVRQAKNFASAGVVAQIEKNIGSMSAGDAE